MAVLSARRYVRITGLLGLCCIFAAVYTLWYSVNSDKDDISPILTQLIPAGHCLCQSSTTFECSSCLKAGSRMPVNLSIAEDWKFRYGEDDRNLGLTKNQCLAAFPGLFEDIERGVSHWAAKGGIRTGVLDKISLVPGMTRGSIFDGSLYVVATKSRSEDHRRKTIAILNAMHRALVSAPDQRTIPNADFVFTVEDKISDVAGPEFPIWVSARKASEASLFLMPDFSYWAWDNMIGSKNNAIGPYDSVVEKAKQLESGLDFARKEPKLVWRGKLSFAPKLRRVLLDVTRSFDWSAVRELNWNVKQNYLTLEDHCKYQYIAHVEGRSYSASLKYRQACRSVIVIHKLQYIQHHHYLLSSSGSTQNYVEVERDFSDLPAKMAHLLSNPTEAERIANNSIETFRERYLTSAAEACYWRYLWERYASVWEDPDERRQNTAKKQARRGMRFESFILFSSREMLDFIAS